MLTDDGVVSPVKIDWVRGIPVPRGVVAGAAARLLAAGGAPPPA